MMNSLKRIYTAWNDIYVLARTVTITHTTYNTAVRTYVYRICVQCVVR